MLATGVVYVVCLMGGAGVCLFEKTATDIAVVKVLDVGSGGDFSCKVKGLSNVGSLPVRIRIRGLEHDKARRIRQFVSERLNGAGRIVLKNIRMRNYFRAEADVEIDGKSLGEALVKAGFARRIPPPTEKTAQPLKSRGILSPASPQSTVAVTRPAAAGRRAPLSKPPNRPVALKTPVTSDLSNITPDTTFEEALEIIRNAVDPPLPLVIMWRDIEENGYIRRTTPVGIEGLGNNTSPGQALKLVLTAVSVEGAELEYVVEGGVITVATRALGLGKRRYTRIYDTAELLAAPAGIPGMFGGGGYGGYGGFGGMGGYGGVGGIGGYGGFGGMGGYGGFGGFGNYGYNRRGNRSYNSRRPGWY